MGVLGILSMGFISMGTVVVLLNTLDLLLSIC